MQGFLMILLKIPASSMQFSANKLLVQKVLSVFQQSLIKLFKFYLFGLNNFQRFSIINKNDNVHLIFIPVAVCYGI